MEVVDNDEVVAIAEAMEVVEDDVNLKVISNTLIMDKIFGSLRPSDFLALRLASKNLCHQATATLKKEKLLKVKIDKLDKIDDLIPLLESETFPTSAFEWDLGKIVGKTPEGGYDRVVTRIEDLSEKIGKHAKDLCLRGFSTVPFPRVRILELPIPRGDLREEAAEQSLALCIRAMLVNSCMVEKLMFRDFAFKRPMDLSKLKLEFPFLRRIKFQDGRATNMGSLLETIIKGSPNLGSIQGATMDLMTAIMNTGKAKLVESVEIQGLKDDDAPYPENVTVAFRRFVSSGVELKHVKSSLKRRDALTELLGQLIVANQRTLKSIVAPSLHWVPVVSSSGRTVFKKLEVLVIRDPRWLSEPREHDREHCHRVFPANVLVSQLFPALKTVKLALKGIKEMYLEKYFPDDMEGIVSAFPTVEKLFIECPYDAYGMKFVAQKFPHVKEVKILQVVGSYAHSMTDDIWNLPQSVESLTLHFLAVDHHAKIKRLDTIVTGIQNRKLPAVNVDDIKKFNRAKFTTRKGIWKLQGLRNFEIIIDGNEEFLLKNLSPKRWKHAIAAAERVIKVRGEIKSKKDDLKWVKKGMKLKTRISQAREAATTFLAAGGGVSDLMLPSSGCMVPMFIDEKFLTIRSGMLVLNSGSVKTRISYDNAAHYAGALKKILSPLEPYLTVNPYYKSQKIVTRRYSLPLYYGYSTWEELIEAGAQAKTEKTDDESDIEHAGSSSANPPGADTDDSEFEVIDMKDVAAAVDEMDRLFEAVYLDSA